MTTTTRELDCSDLTHEQVQRIMSWHEAIIDAACTEARIDELEKLNLNAAQGGWHKEKAYRTWTYIADRFVALKATLEGDK